MPNFFDPSRVGQLVEPRIVQVIEEAGNYHVAPASEDTRREALLIVDPQLDFLDRPGAPLPVPGSCDDIRRLVEMIIRKTLDGTLTTIIVSMDLHLPFHIFSPDWWIDTRTGEHPAPYTEITVESIRKGYYLPLYEVKWSLDYVERLESQAKKKLMIWPYHCLAGTPGQAIDPLLMEAIYFHSAVRQNQPVFIFKGAIAKTEFYSVLEPEVKVPEDPSGGLNTPILDIIAGHNQTDVAGEARTHCVLETCESVVRYFGTNNPDVIQRLRFLSDCSSNIPGFEAAADARFRYFESVGFVMVKSTSL